MAFDFFYFIIRHDSIDVEMKEIYFSQRKRERERWKSHGILSFSLSFEFLLHSAKALSRLI
jgi:RNA-binding protein YlmH